MVDHVERLFMCLSAICVSLEGMLFFFSVVLDSGNTLFGTFIYVQRRHKLSFVLFSSIMFGSCENQNQKCENFSSFSLEKFICRLDYLFIQDLVKKKKSPVRLSGPDIFLNDGSVLTFSIFFYGSWFVYALCLYWGQFCFPFSFFFFFLATPGGMRDPPRPLQWKCEVLTTGPPGKAWGQFW